MFLRNTTKKFTDGCLAEAERLQKELHAADAIVIGAGAGLSTAAGFVYDGQRFWDYFGDFAKAYAIRDMYSGGFYPFSTLEEYWAYWSRYIYINRYMDAPKPVYQELLRLVQDNDYFVITTNVDHCFQKAGFDKKRLFYTQGDYGLFQCSEPCHPDTYDNASVIRKMTEVQGFKIGDDGKLTLPEGSLPKMEIPSSLIPRCPRCGKPMTMNLRADDCFAEDGGWHLAAERYSNFLRTRERQRMLFLELGVGYNTPGIIKYPFWRMTMQNPKSVYTCINIEEAYAPEEIRERAVCISGDIGGILRQL